MKVGQLMTHDALICSPSDTLNRAAQMMWERDCGSVAVVDDDGKAIGMITDRDICMAAYTQGRPLWEILVSSAASRRVVTVHEDDGIDRAEALMQEHKIRRLVVVDDLDHPIGILALNDLARRVSVKRRHGELDADAIAQTLAAVCTPTPRVATAE